MRFHDWPERLDAFMAERNARAAEYGNDAHDCVSCAAAWVKLATGVDPMEGADRYSGKEEADAYLARASLIDLIDERLERRKRASFAQRGDVGLAVYGDETLVVIVLGDTITAPAAAGGMRAIPRHFLSVAWRV